ncbi:MAG: chromate transporter [Sphaerochaeta sp.]|nr:chromate transporter [Sphaerochaeta sp.]
MSKKQEKTTFWQLYTSFLKIGGLTFGGGLAMLPMLQREVIGKYGWVTEEQLLDIYAIGQCTPGIIAINTASMIGYKRRGVWGSIVATLGMVTPSLVLITLLASILSQFEESILLQRAFGGIRVAVCALITQSVFTLYKKSIVDLPTLLLCLATVVGTIFFHLSPIVFVLVGIVFGLVVQNLKRRAAK